MADAIATIVDDRLEVTIYGADLLAPLVAQAEQAVTDAETQVALGTAQAAASALSASISRRNARELMESNFALGHLPIGFIDPADYFSNYENPYDVELYSTGASIWPMIPAGEARLEWLEGGITARLGGVTYVSISLAKRADPTRQGTAFNTYYVNYATGADTGPGTSSGAPWKRVGYALTNATRPALVIVEQDWIGNDSWVSTHFSDWGDLRLLGVPQTEGQERTWVLLCRESQNKASFSWTNNGDGSWTSSASMNDAIKAGKAMFDLSILDDDGAPLPMVPVVDKATCQATPNSWFNEVVGGGANDVLTVHLLGGAEPNPGVNWAYCESSGNRSAMLDDGDTGLIENLAFIHNNATTSAALQVRPITVTVPGAHVAHTAAFWAINCAAFGSSGGGIVFVDIARGGTEGFVCKYVRDDGVNASTFYTYPNVNTGDRTLEGQHIHIWHFGGVCEYLGENGFAGQPALLGSSNVSTSHSQCRVTRLNVRGGYGNGSTFADVSGAKTWSLNCYPHDPTVAAGGSIPGGAAPRANYWADGVSDAAATTQMSLLYCGGSIDPTGVTFAASRGGVIEYAHHKGDVSVLAGQTGTVTDVG